MIQWIRFLLTCALVLCGLVVLCIGVFGVFRFRYAANRMHAAALNDTLGAGLCLIGFAISAPDVFSAIKLLLVVVFLWLSSPVASHLLCRLEVETNEQRGDYMTVQEGIFDEDGFASPETASQARNEGAAGGERKESQGRGEK